MTAHINDIHFNAHHAPIGAFSSFTLGYPGPKGGMGSELGKPADQHIFIGCESKDEPGTFEALPFFGESGTAEEDFVKEDQGDTLPYAKLSAFPNERTTREFSPCIDKWCCNDDFEFTLYSPTSSIPNPKNAVEAELKQVLIPAVFAEIRLDNTKCAHDRRVFFGFEPSNVKSHIRECWALADRGKTALAVGNDYGIATDSANANTAIHFAINVLLGENDRDRFHFGNGTLGIVDTVVPAGEDVTIPFVIAFHQKGIVTSGIECSYFYERYFPTLESVIEHGLEHFDSYRETALREDANWKEEAAHLNSSQRFQLAHSIRSYYGSTQLLDHDGEPFWVVNEGEYRMINTLDLTVDQLFFEMRQNPWTTANVLDNFLKHYSYTDEVFEGDSSETTHPGGLSFSHDMGVANCFTRPGDSCYEIPKLKGCFSYMTHEELVNWLSCALVYIKQADDGEQWMNNHATVFPKLLQSLLNRDATDPKDRNGIMGLDSIRTQGGGEITTYDSLDASLGKSSGNCYLGVKTWAVYLGLERVFQKLGQPELSEICKMQARRIVSTLLEVVKSDGSLPASVEADSGFAIIPIIEGLGYANFNGCEAVFDPQKDPENYRLVELLKTHLEQVLVKGKCLFEDNGWRLTTGNTNSWLSKIYLCQYIARELLQLKSEATGEASDQAHEAWLKNPENAYWCWGDQFYAGELGGSRYYPRGVTSVLWLNEQLS